MRVFMVLFMMLIAQVAAANDAPVISSGTVSPAGATWTARASSLNWESITSSSDGTKLAAVAWGDRIYTSTNSGMTWTARDSNRLWISITSSSDGTKLAAVVYGGQIYTSTDSGATWTAQDSARNWRSITSSSDGTKLAAAVYGSGQIYTSPDSGLTWTARGSALDWRSITSSSDGTKLAAVAWGDYIYTSPDSGVTWAAQDSARDWRSITSSSDGAKLAAVAWGGQIYTSTDSGGTWTARDGTRAWYSITSSSDGTKLAAVVDGGQIYTSIDSGVTWTAQDSNRNWRSITSSSDGTKLAAAAYGQIYTSAGTRSIAVTMSEDSSPTAFALTLNASDADGGNTLTWSISSGASNGIATATGNGFSKVISYIPTADFNGSDSFVVEVTDSALTDTITVNVTILPVVSYAANGASGAVPSSQNKINGVGLTLATSGSLVKTGSTFSRWNTAADDSGTPYSAGATYAANTSVTLYAQWTLNTYSVTYVTNNATNGTAPAAQTKTYDVSLTLATNSGTLVKTGSTFAGWNTAADGNGTAYAAGASYIANAAQTLYAKWTLDTYSVTYNGNGLSGGTAPAAQTKTYDVDLTLATNGGTLVKTGSTFAGWNTAADGRGTTYAATGITYTDNAGLVLHAKWTLDTYAVTYNGNGFTGGTAPAAQTKTYDVSLTLATNSGTLVKTGSTFAGWNTAADGSGTTYAAGASYTANATQTLYAKWTLDTYAVTYDGNGFTGGTAPAAQTKTYNVGLTLATNSGTLVKTGSTFAGWNTAADGSGTTFSAGGIYTSDASTMLFAVWQPVDGGGGGGGSSGGGGGCGLGSGLSAFFLGLMFALRTALRGAGSGVQQRIRRPL